jgi:hypothetical protein
MTEVARWAHRGATSSNSPASTKDQLATAPLGQIKNPAIRREGEEDWAVNEPLPVNPGRAPIAIEAVKRSNPGYCCPTATGFVGILG